MQLTEHQQELVQNLEQFLNNSNTNSNVFLLKGYAGTGSLDFHWYCSRVIHWNLPGNPIDIEQREGRVNRYKSLLVRRRVKEIYASELRDGSDDIWTTLFNIADKDTKGKRTSDLIPYWHLSKGSAVIERIIPMMPMSREVGRIKESLKILSLYRLAFGQPRQEELLTNLLERNMSNDEIKEMTNALVINLAPLIHKYKEIYRKNNFRVGDVYFTFENLGDNNLFSKRFAILTAWDPNNTETSLEINLKKNKELKRDIQALKFSFEKAVGYLDDHEEVSYCIYDISIKKVLELADKYNQYSIFYCDGKTIGYYEVETSKAIIEKKL